jgi:YHS domain-containing protein
MSEAKDPVCGMMVEPENAAASTTYESQEVFFCSDECRREFEANPARYYDRLERQEPPFTVSQGFAAPKFGSAASGGLEYEPNPEQHDQR